VAPASHGPAPISDTADAMRPGITVAVALDACRGTLWLANSRFPSDWTTGLDSVSGEINKLLAEILQIGTNNWQQVTAYKKYFLVWRVEI
jgi:hypothetical protein